MCYFVLFCSNQTNNYTKSLCFATILLRYFHIFQSETMRKKENTAGFYFVPGFYIELIGS